MEGGLHGLIGVNVQLPVRMVLKLGIEIVPILLLSMVETTALTVATLSSREYVTILLCVQVIATVPL